MLAGPVPASSPMAGSGGLRHRQTRSHEATAAALRGLEPLRLLDSGTHARLETILSGKDGLAAAASPERRRRPAGDGRRCGRRLLELELKEVKGLRDLGEEEAEVRRATTSRKTTSPAARDPPGILPPPPWRGRRQAE